MVSAHGAGAREATPPSGGVYLALARALQALPALALGMLCLRAGDMAGAQGSGQILPALGNDLVALLRYGSLAVLLAFAVFLAWPRRGKWTVGAIWSLLLLVQALLIQYHATTGVPLGADLFAYSWNEIVTTAHGGAVSGTTVLGLGAALLALWATLLRLTRHDHPPLAPLTLVAAVLVLAGGSLLARSQVQGEAAPPSYNKLAFFLDDGIRWTFADASEAPAAAASKTLDPAHPFLRAEQTPDTLGPLFDTGRAGPPNIVILIVEGLGRSFSGPGARLGSFTPFLDQLAGRSLYFENFLATQGRTFGVLPSLLGSLPFAANGFAAMPAMPAHHALPAILRQHGYATRFYTGSNLEFDNEGAYLRQAGIDTLVSQRDFPKTLKTSSEWGYADSELVALALQGERAAAAKPHLTIIQTSSTHTPFEFPGKARYLERVEQHLDTLGIEEAKRAPYRRQRDIYASLLYADDALRAWFEGAATLPGHANTIYLVTGDHRLPEIPMDNRLERYHVPLIVHSPMLKRPLRIKSVSSHFDLAPALLAYLANHHAIPTPAQVTWLGTGLDLEPSFRNLHALPLKQTKTEPSDFVSGTTYLAQDKLYTITDGMNIEPLASAGARAQAERQLQAFAAANNALIRSGSLAPPAALREARPYAASGRALAATEVAAQSGTLFVSETHITQATNGDLVVSARFANRAARATPPFVPLLVISDDKGRELAEAYGKAQVLAPSATLLVHLPVDAAKLGPGVLFASMIPSDPDNGKPVGTGQYHVPLRAAP